MQIEGGGENFIYPTTEAAVAHRKKYKEKTSEKSENRTNRKIVHLEMGNPW